MKNYFSKIEDFFKNNAFWQKWGGWILAGVFSIILVVLVSGEVQKAWNEGYDNCSPEQHKMISNDGGITIAIFALPIALIFIGLLVLPLAMIYYYTIHRFFFHSSVRGILVAFIMFVLVMEEVLSLIINKVTNKDTTDYEVLFQVMILFCCCIAFSFIKDFYKKQKEQAKLLQQKTEAELTSLKAQVNPHFLFNSLNNIYGTAMVEEAPRTANSLQQLSSIMRYVLEKSKMEYVNIADEIKFLNDYTFMHELRIPKRDNINIDVKIDWDEQPAEIAPLLLNPIIENAFKYGISVEQPCFVKIDFEVVAQKLRFNSQNSILLNNSLEQGTGMGLDNVRQRLALAYPNRHKLSINEENGIFEVKLEIEL